MRGCSAALHLMTYVPLMMVCVECDEGRPAGVQGVTESDRTASTSLYCQCLSDRMTGLSRAVESGSVLGSPVGESGIFRQ